MNSTSALQSFKPSVIEEPNPAELRRRELVSPSNLAKHILFNGNRPYLDPEYRDELVKATAESVIADVSAYGPSGAVQKFVGFVFAIWPNLVRIRINLSYKDQLAAKLDSFDSQITEIRKSLQVVSPETDELWRNCIDERTKTLQQDLEQLMIDYRKQYNSNGRGARRLSRGYR